MGACKDTVQIDVTKSVQPFESQQNLPSRFLCGDKEFLMIDPVGLLNPKPVSYTHLDVYKRQAYKNYLLDAVL